MQAVYVIWVPAHAITFSLIPPNFRVAWVASVSFGWLIVLSYLAPMESAPVELAATTPAKKEARPPPPQLPVL